MENVSFKGKVFVIFMIFAVSGCGSIQSTQWILKADKARHKAMLTLSTKSDKDDVIVRDDYGRETISYALKGKAIYYFHMADAYLLEARELQARGEHEQARKVAEKSIEFSHRAESESDSIVEANKPHKEKTVPVQAVEKKPAKEFYLRDSDAREKEKGAAPGEPVEQEMNNASQRKENVEEKPAKEEVDESNSETEDVEEEKEDLSATKKETQTKESDTQEEDDYARRYRELREKAMKRQKKSGEEEQ